MSSQREPVPVVLAPSNPSKVTVGQFAERFRGEVIPLSNTFGNFCASAPLSEGVVKDSLEEPIAALPRSLPETLPRISILLVPYIELSGDRRAGKEKKS